MKTEEKIRIIKSLGYDIKTNPNIVTISPVSILVLKSGVINRKIRKSIDSDLTFNHLESTVYLFLDKKKAVSELERVFRTTESSPKIVEKTKAVQIELDCEYRIGKPSNGNIDIIFNKLTKGMTNDELGGQFAIGTIL